MPQHDPLPGRTPARAPLDEAEIRRRQKSRSIVTAVILFALIILFYAISIAKML